MVFYIRGPVVPDLREKEGYFMKQIRKILAFALAVSLLLTLAGCTSKDEKLREKLTGSWKCDVDISETLRDGIASGVEDDESLRRAVNEMELGALTMAFDLDIAADGSYTLCVNSQSIQAMIEDATPPITKMMRSYLEATLNEVCAQADMTLETLYQLTGVTNLDEYVEIAMGTTLDDFVLELFQQAFNSAGLEELRETGTLSVKDGKITLTTQESSCSATYDTGSDTLTLEEYVKELNMSQFTFTRK